MADTPEPTATERVRAALAAGRAVSRKDFEHHLREALGLSARRARRVAAEGARALGAADDDTDTAQLAARLSRLEQSLRL